MNLTLFKTESHLSRQTVQEDPANRDFPFQRSILECSSRRLYSFWRVDHALMHWLCRQYHRHWERFALSLLDDVVGLDSKFHCYGRAHSTFDR